MFSLFASNCEFTLSATFPGSQAPVNCLSFSKNGRFLASGGDDEALRIWDLSKRELFQSIQDRLERWGQITCVKWLTGVSSDHGNVLCFGTGRGLILVYQCLRDLTSFKELSKTPVFTFNEVVECIDFDRSKSRLIVCSVAGKFKAFTVEKNGTMIPLWNKEPEEQSPEHGVIPRSVKFVGKGDRIVIFGLQSGIMTLVDASNGQEAWSKTLASSVGNAAFNLNDDWMLVDNLVDGFDLYQYPRTSPSESFHIPCEKSYVFGCTFVGGKLVACGSDHGLVYLYSVDTGRVAGKLRHGSWSAMVQVIEAFTTADADLIGTASGNDRGEIHLWERRLNRPTSNDDRTCHCSGLTVIIMFNAALFAIFIWNPAHGVDFSAFAPFLNF